MTQVPAVPARSTVWDVFRVFLGLGLTSFGGPVAHLGYFRAEFVDRRRWMDDRAYADLVALSQFLPGPASSQVGFGVGLLRAGGWGAVAAFVGFTLPSAVLMTAFAFGAAALTGPIGDGLLTGLKIVAVAIVAHAVWGMARTLTPDKPRVGIAVIALLATVVLVGWAGQIAALLIGVIGGVILCRFTADRPVMLHFPVRRSVGITSLVTFVVLLIGSPIAAAATGIGGVALFDAFYRAGALVFGGGHVMLPLLQAGVVETGWVTEAQFLAGYAAAGAVPGPLFTFAGYLGALAAVGPGGIGGALIALIAVFLPGFLLLVGVLPFWNMFNRRAGVRAAMRGVGAAVVGMLAAALYSPVFTAAITGPAAFCLAVVCLVLLAWRLSAWSVVLVGAAGGVLIGLT